jgi:hypothetical protein
MIRGRGRAAGVVVAITAALAATAACLGDDPVASIRRDAGGVDRGDADGGDRTDAGGDAGQDGGTYCSRIVDASYCEDFDTTPDVTALDPESSDPALKPAFTRETYRSAPRSLAMGIPEGSAAPSYLVYKRAFGGTRTVRAELDWNFASAPEVPGTLQAITLKRTGPQFAFGRGCSADADSSVRCTWYVSRCMMVDAAVPCEDLFTFPSPPFVGKWARVYLEARLEKAGHLAFGVVGEPPIFDADVEGATDAVAPEDPTVLTIGLANLQGPSPGLWMFVDSVVVYER